MVFFSKNSDCTQSPEAASLLSVKHHKDSDTFPFIPLVTSVIEKSTHKDVTATPNEKE
jgi:hypothetical protein